MRTAHHVAFIVNDAPFFLSHRRALAEALLAHGCATTLIAPPHDTVLAQLNLMGVRFEPWHVSRRGTHIWREVKAIVDLTSILRRLKPDLIHNITQKPVLYGSLAARLARRPRVVNAVSGLGYAFTEGTGGGGLLGRGMLLMHKMCHGSLGTRTIFQNPDDLNIFINNRITPLPQARLIKGSGVDPDTFKPATALNHDPIVVVPARMLIDKGIGEAVAATRHLRTSGFTVSLRLAGGIDHGNPAAIPESRLRTWHSENDCEWLGQVGDMIPMFQQARICCLPSYREGLPKALIEAASCGLPIVTCDVPGCREIVRHGDNGLLVPPRDPHALAAALKVLLDDYDLCVRMGRRGRERVIAEFSLDRVVRAHMDIYGELLDDRWLTNDGAA